MNYGVSIKLILSYFMSISSLCLIFCFTALYFSLYSVFGAAFIAPLKIRCFSPAFGRHSLQLPVKLLPAPCATSAIQPTVPKYRATAGVAVICLSAGAYLISEKDVQRGIRKKDLQVFFPSDPSSDF
jgi:hypothetical protein